MKNQAANNGTFIPKPGFTVVQNNVARDWSLSSGALGLYTRIQSYITMENITLTKGSLMERVAFFERRTPTSGALPAVSIKLPNAAMKIIQCTKMMYSSFAVNLWL